MEESLEETKKHINNVNNFIQEIITLLDERAENHDKSKLESPEKEIFAIYTKKLKDCTYMSDEYKNYLKEMKPALDHHYANNSHHPENHEDGINGMTLIDLIEMICDWEAACLRHDNGNIMESIEKNSERFKINDQLKQILINTAKIFK